MSVLTNTFCASGMHLPNGSWATFGGNAAISVGADLVLRSQYGLDPFFLMEKGGGTPSPIYDDVYGDYDGRKSIRILNPCTQADLSSETCQWFDNLAVLFMPDMRWYAAAEALADVRVLPQPGSRHGHELYGLHLWSQLVRAHVPHAVRKPSRPGEPLHK